MPAGKFSQVDAPWWDARPVFIVGGGPSLQGRDLSRLRERGIVLGVNRAADLVPVDATFTLDHNFVAKRREDLRQWAAAHELWIAQAPDEPSPPILGAHYIERRNGDEPLSVDPRYVINGLNSGYSAINLATLKRAREIILLGYDLHPTQGLSHWHGGYPWNVGTAEKYYGRWAQKFDLIARFMPAGVRIINANPTSAIKAFPFATYEEFGL